MKKITNRIPSLSTQNIFLSRTLRRQSFDYAKIKFTTIYVTDKHVKITHKAKVLDSSVVSAAAHPRISSIMSLYKVCHNKCIVPNCTVCIYEIRARVRKYTNSNGKTRISTLMEKLQTWYSWKPIDCHLAITVLCNRWSGIVEGDFFISINKLIEDTVIKKGEAIDLYTWGDSMGLPRSVLNETIASVVTDKVMVFKDEHGRKKARKKSKLLAYNEKTLISALKKRGVKGTKLRDVFAEYENAHNDVFLCDEIFTANGLAWHKKYTNFTVRNGTELFNNATISSRKSAPDICWMELSGCNERTSSGSNNRKSHRGSKKNNASCCDTTCTKK